MNNSTPDHTLSLHEIKRFFCVESVQYIFAARNATHRALVVSNKTGVYQIHAVDLKTGFERQITHTAQGSLFASLSPDGEFIYILNSTDGYEHGHFIRTPFDHDDPVDVTPNAEPFYSYSVSTSDDNLNIAYTAAVDGRNRVYISRQKDGGSFQVQELYKTTHSLSEAICSPDGDTVCVSETAPDTQTTRLLFLDTQTNTLIYHSSSFSDITPLAFSKKLGSKQILARARIDEWYRPIFYTIENATVATIANTVFNGDVWPLLWDERNRELLLCDIYQATQRLYTYDTQTEAVQHVGMPNSSYNFHYGAAATNKNGSYVVRRSQLDTPPQLITLEDDSKTKSKPLPAWSGALTDAGSYTAENIRVRSEDDAEIQMWVLRPTDVQGPMPFIIDVHGGPHGVVFNEYNPEASVWLEHGFGYCAVNYRGSISFGGEFQDAIYGAPGYWETIDVTAARDWLVQNRYATDASVSLTGWSWGGFVVLRALGCFPKKWCAGIAGAGIADYIQQYHDEPAYFQAQDRMYFKGTPTTQRSQYIASSPITYLHDIQAPLYIMHGKNDARCPATQIQNFITKAKKEKKHVEVDWYEAGHTGEFTDVELRTKLMKKMVAFIARHVKK